MQAVVGIFGYSKLSKSLIIERSIRYYVVNNIFHRNGDTHANSP